MKINIMQKMLLIVSLPILIVILITLNSIKVQYNISQRYNNEVIDLHVMQSSSDLIHHFQIERGLSSMYLNSKANKEIKNALLQHQTKTDIAIQTFKQSLKKLNKQNISLSNSKYIQELMLQLSIINKLRNKVLNHKANFQEVFKNYKQFINKLILLLNGFKINTDSKATNLDILALSRIIYLQEFLGQERALVSSIADKQKINQDQLNLFKSLIISQQTEEKELLFLVEESSLKQKIKDLEIKYADSFYQITKDEILSYEKKRVLLNDIFKLIGYGGLTYDLYMYKSTKEEIYFQNYLQKKILFDKLMKKFISMTREWSSERKKAQKLKNIFFYITKTNLDINHKKNLTLFQTLENLPLYLNADAWFTISSQKINDIHNIEDQLFLQISKSLNSTIQNAEHTLIKELILLVITILFLLLGSYLVARKIMYSIHKLSNGIDDFFKFLNFEIKEPIHINTKSNDEINAMALHVNEQIKLREVKLEEDLAFIDEATQVVKLMKDGNFEEIIYFEPSNPHLKELKDVFNELIHLIQDKIKEQTSSLQELNATLQDEVYYQTLELEQQVQDITISRDKAIQAEIAKDEFLANMSHEIRTPLNAILGFVHILKKRVKEEKNIGYLDIIHNSGNSLLTIINDILDFSKIQSGKFNISKHSVNPVDEFSNTCLLFASKAYEKNIIYAVYIDPKLPSSLELDATRVTQIISNLLSNAIKFTPEDGEIKVKITFDAKDLVISIQDSGIGISKENQKKVFSAFEQADGSTTRKYGGTGLGLSISSKLASLMEGTLSLKSEENKGSTFTLKLPTKVLDAQPQEFLDTQKNANSKVAILDNSIGSSAYGKLIKKYLQDFGMTNITEISEFEKDFDLIFFVPDDDYNEDIVNAKIPAVAMLRSNTIKLADFEHIEALYAPFVPKSILESISNMKIKQEPIKEEDIEVQFQGNILVAEDNKTNQMLISFLLDDYGLEHTMANNGVEAVELFKEGKYDLVLMDENMPELNGIGAMQQIKEYEQKNSLILTPIIALTASVLKTDKEKFSEAGMDGFVGKPIDNKELEAELSKYLKKV